MRVTASALRADIYRILDQALTTGVAVEVVRKGRVIRIVPDRPVSKLNRLTKRRAYRGDPDEIISMHWLQEWSEWR